MIRADTPLWREIAKIPNLISIARLAFLPFMVQAILNSAWALALVVGTIIALSDFLDGFVARTFKMSTRLGAILDPLIDRIAILVVLFALLIADRISIYLALSIFLRDLMIALILKLRGQDLTVEVIYLGKIGTWFLYVCFVLVFFESIVKNDVLSDFTDAGFVWAVMIYWLAGFSYIRRN